MDEKILQQISNLVGASQKILITSKAKADGDSIGSMIALSNILTKTGKETILAVSEPIPEHLGFLPETKKISTGLDELNNFLIHLDISRTSVDKLSYAGAGKALHIAITPKDGGKFAPEDVSFDQEQFRPDLIMTVDTPDLNSIGQLYHNNAQLFYEVPVINIDHSAENERYGRVNLIELTATSTTEIIAQIINIFGPVQQLSDKSITTPLLAGIIHSTESFQSVQTSPRSFSIAADLIAAGADQQEIIRHLYKTRPLATLKLWGRVLARAKSDREHRLVWSMVTRDDFKKSQANHGDLDGVTDELLSSVPEAEVFVLIYQHQPHEVNGKIHAAHNADAARIAGVFGGTGHKNTAEFTVPHKDILEAENIILKKIRAYQKNAVDPRRQR